MTSELERRIEILDGSDSAAIGRSVPVKDILATKHIVFLGDPGSGKTFLFEALSTQGIYQKARSFISVGLRAGVEGPVFIDALDEYRSRAKEGDLVLDLVRNLASQRIESSRISCRTIDWFGDSDIEPLKEYFGNDSWLVVRLEELSFAEGAAVLEHHGIESAEEFINEAVERGVGYLTTNPQSLLMLNAAVKISGWPESREELFDKAVSFLISESNDKHSLAVGKNYSTSQLLSLAEEIAAVYLLSGFECITLMPAENDSELSIDEFDDKRRSAFTCLAARRLFNSIEIHKSSFLHRTFAEFLGARYVARRVHEGLPVRRALSLLGSSYIPTSDVRGLFSWLPVFLPTEAEWLVGLDPYAVCMYGDASKLSSEAKVKLLAGLSEIAKMNPAVFSEISEHLTSVFIDRELDSQLLNIMKGDSHDRFKQFVVSAIKDRPLNPDFRAVLEHILSNPETSDSLRIEVAKVISQEDSGKTFVRSYCSSDNYNISGRILLARSLYGPVFEPRHIFPLIMEYVNEEVEDISLNFSVEYLVRQFPVDQKSDLLEILLDELSLEVLQNISDYPEKQFGNIFAVCLVGVLSAKGNCSDNFKALVAYCDLRSKLSIYNKYDAEVSDYIKKNLRGLVFCFFDGIESFEDELLDLELIRKLFFWNSSPEELVSFAVEYVSGFEEGTFSARHLLLVAQLCLVSGSQREIYLKIVDNLTESISEERYERVTVSAISSYYFKNASLSRELAEKRSEQRSKNIKTVRSNIDRVRSGDHIGCLEFIAKVYLGDFDKCSEGSPTDRIKAQLPEELIDDCLAGLQNFSLKFPKMNMKPFVRKVGNSIFYNPQWPVFLAGVDLTWVREGGLSKYNKDQLVSAYILAERFPIYSKHGTQISVRPRDWLAALAAERPDVAEAAIDLVFMQIISDSNRLSRIVEFDYDQHNEVVTGKMLRLLGRSHLEPISDMEVLLKHAIVREPNLDRVKEIFSGLLERKIFRKSENHAFVAAVALIICGKGISDLRALLGSSSTLDWIIIDTIKGLKESLKKGYEEILETSLLRDLIGLFGQLFDYAEMPTGSWSGIHNSFDASQFLLELIRSLSRIRTEEATLALVDLTETPEVESYHFYIKRMLFDKRVVEHDIFFKKPSLKEVRNTFENLSPSNAEDLFALFVDIFREVKKEILYSNTSKFRLFWNTDNTGKVTTPKIEDVCRDVLHDLLDNRVKDLGISIEPEALMAQQKRADLIASSNRIILPIEIKRSSHSDLWTACADQLERMYTVRPEALGFGVYVVFWFGCENGIRLAAPPGGGPKPRTAGELEGRLRALNKNEKVSVFVIDVTPPFD